MGGEVVHVRPQGDGRWIVETEDSQQVLSVHHDARSAASSAVAFADGAGGAEVVVHDRYQRARVLQRGGTPAPRVA